MACGYQLAGDAVMSNVGIVPLDTTGNWMGGRYYLQHLIRSVAALPERERLGMCDVWWERKADEDPFKEVRDYLTGSAVITFPKGLAGRVTRKVRRTLAGWRDTRDLFYRAGISSLFPVLPCENPGIPYVFWLPDFQHKYYPHYYSEQMLRQCDEYSDSNIAQAALVVLSSQHALQDFQRNYPNHIQKARVVHFCSVPDDRWWDLDPECVARDKGIEGKFVVVSNQFSHSKNHEVIFEAMRILRDSGKDVKLVCTGSLYGYRGQDYLDRLRTFVSVHQLEATILILGLLPRREQIALTRGAAAALQPSRFEGWSTVIEDAKTLGKKILASDIPVHREQLAESDYASLLPVDDPTAWAKAISASVAGPMSQLRNREDVLNANFADRVTNTGRSFVAAMRDAISRANYC
jgi:glycosyltransferase involved in cell wall biosynthesis